MAKDKLFTVTTEGKTKGAFRVHQLFAPDEDEARFRVETLERGYQADPDESLVGYKITSVEPG